jgi:pSer/pThr/pTyr-binding forkhead associated (FHA) protein
MEEKDEIFEKIIASTGQIRFPHPPSTVATVSPMSKSTIDMIGKLTLNDEREFILDGKEEFLIGRSDKMAGVLPEIDLGEADKEMVTSRKHSRILKKGDTYLVEDLNSTNFTYLNGKILSPKTPTILDDGDVIRIGKLYLVFSRIRKN